MKLNGHNGATSMLLVPSNRFKNRHTHGSGWVEVLQKRWLFTLFLHSVSLLFSSLPLQRSDIMDHVAAPAPLLATSQWVYETMTSNSR